MKSIIAALLIACSTVSCGQQEAESISNDSAVYAAAVENPQRPDADRERDAGRKPAEVLQFFGIVPGMHVLDMFSGGGYYAEIIAGVVGADGNVVAHSNSAYLNFVGEEFAARHAEGRLANVAVLMAENNELALEASQFDAITMVLSYHDTYWVAPEDGWPEIDRAALNAELFSALKPGGILGVVDHQAIPGSPGETGGTVHRIDKAIVIADLEQAGFVLAAESELLQNPDDDHSKGVFDPSIRGKTDRFVLTFRKPE
jgi:predicted methyltransferase